ncbi:MAG: hypothetical protein ACOX7H_05270 [Bacillota bacterium]|jgi:hypothetical protein
MKALQVLRKSAIFLFLLLIIILLLIFGQIFSGDNHQGSQEYPAGQEQSNYISDTTPVRQEIYYNSCHHLVTTDQTGNSKFVNKNFTQLHNEGWEVFWAENGQAVIFKEISALCPADEGKCFLAAYEGQVAIFSGPLGSSDEPTEVSGISIDNLDPEVKEKLLQGGIEFESMEDLLVALENLDEY